MNFTPKLEGDYSIAKLVWFVLGAVFWHNPRTFCIETDTIMVENWSVDARCAGKLHTMLRSSL